MIFISLLLAVTFSTPIIGLFVVPNTSSGHARKKQYEVVDLYNRDNLFGSFSFFQGADPQHGFVEYVDLAKAKANKLIGTVPTATKPMYIGVEHHNRLKKSNGRQSVRLTSKKSYNHGLFVADIEHMPGGICGVWPSLKLRGSSPNGGEIDIIEGINVMSRNAMTLHTSGTCKNRAFNGFTGSITSQSCGMSIPGKNPGTGCSISAQAAKTFGDGFNQAGGGVFVAEWTSKAINIWLFPRNGIPREFKAGDYFGPHPSAWPPADASFTLDCDIDKHFKDMQIIIDTNLCGDWAGGQWADSPCLEKTKTNVCADYVRDNPAAFKNAYWQINHLTVYKHKS